MDGYAYALDGYAYAFIPKKELGVLFSRYWEYYSVDSCIIYSLLKFELFDGGYLIDVAYL